MLEIHYRPMTGSIAHVIADEEGIAELKRMLLYAERYETPGTEGALSIWHGVPIFRPGMCDCPIVDAYGRDVLDRCIQCQLGIDIGHHH